MKYLLITMMLMIGLLFPKNILSEERRFWYKGDSIISAFICHKEKDIMKIVKADTISEEEVLARMFALAALGNCGRFPAPVPFTIDHVVTPYTDFKGDISVVVALRPIDTENLILPKGMSRYKVMVFAIALGEPGTAKDRKSNDGI